MSKDIRLSREERQAAVARMFSAARAMHAAAAQADEAFADFLGINRTDARCLDIIHHLGPITAGRLASESGLTSGAVTTVVDRLETAGYVRRLPDPGDRRKVMIATTDEADSLDADMYAPLEQHWEAELDEMSDEELLTVIGFLETSRRIDLEHAALLRGLGGKPSVPLRYRLEQARQLKQDAKFLYEQVKAHVSDRAGAIRQIRRELEDWARAHDRAGDPGPSRRGRGDPQDWNPGREDRAPRRGSR